MENTNINTRGKYSPPEIKTYIGGLREKPPISSKQITPVRSVENFWLAAQTNEIFAELSPFLEKVSFTENDFIYQHGDAVNYVYFPETAVISEFQILKDGRTIEIAMTGNEGIIGLLSVFDTPTAKNWAQVLVSGSAFRIRLETLKNEIFQHQPLQIQMFEFISKYVRQISQRVVCNNYHTLEARFCNWLLMLRDRQKNEILKLTQEQIARILGAHRPSITHIAQNLQKKKIISYSRGKLKILDQPAMQTSSCDCYLEANGRFLNF